MSEPAAEKPAPTVIKKYANRRLYNTATSSYVTLDHLAKMVKDGEEFAVHDARTGENITHAVLAQIILDQEAKGQALLPTEFLRQLIRFYGDSLQAFLPRYLELSMQTFLKNQEQLRRYVDQTFGGFMPLRALEQMGRQNMALIERAFTMFNPFVAGTSDGAEDKRPGEGVPDRELDEIKARLHDIQERLDALAKRSEDSR